MPLQAATSVENNFRNGLMTEASGLNFPENACTATYNCVFSQDGSVQRRPGFDYETSYQTKTISLDDKAITNYLWGNVDGDGNVSLVVLQVGLTLYFYVTENGNISNGILVDTISISAFKASGVDDADVAIQECQFSDGNGLLFVTHPYCAPFYVEYDSSLEEVTPTQINIMIRDFEGVDDGLAIDNRPTSSLAALSKTHHYNLLNQGWTETNLAAWDTARTDLPSNSDVMYVFKNADDVFDMATVVNAFQGNTPAPKGHYILSLFNQDRNTASGLTTVPPTTTGTARPSTSAFFAGRVFYSGINTTGFNSNVYFTQIIERKSQYGDCYQAQDPTAEDLHDLLPSDGGVIKIPEAGTIYKLVSIVGALVIFASNGIWIVSGSTGLGFIATDYTVNKLSSIRTLSASSFVDVGGFPAWWNSESIYLLSSDGQNPTVNNLSDSRIKSFYDSIPNTSKITAKGAFNSITGVIQWVFRSTVSTGVTEIYQYDQILNYDVRTQAFYPWIVDTTRMKLSGIICLEVPSGIYATEAVTGDDGPLYTLEGEEIFTYSATTSNPPNFKYLVSTGTAITFAETNNLTYYDWVTAGFPTNFSSYFISGYKLRGEGLKKFQSNYVRLFSRTLDAVSYTFQALWDFAIVGSTGRWGSKQIVTHESTDYGFAHKKLKARGHGIAVQFKISSVEAEPFDVIGWATFETGNQMP